jgi:hypothetical protein
MSKRTWPTKLGMFNFNNFGNYSKTLNTIWQITQFHNTTAYLYIFGNRKIRIRKACSISSIVTQILADYVTTGLYT